MVPVARISKLFGTDGGVRVNLYNSFPEDFDPHTDPLFLEVDRLPVPVWCERFEPRGASGAFILFADLDSPERIGEFTGQQLFVCENDDQTAEDEFYMEDLIGFRVEADGFEGEVTDFYDSEANPLFGVTFDGREVLIPAAEEFIAGIDFEGKHIKMVLPAGLLEL